MIMSVIDPKEEPTHVMSLSTSYLPSTPGITLPRLYRDQLYKIGLPGKSILGDYL